MSGDLSAGRPDLADVFKLVCDICVPHELVPMGLQNEAIEAELRKRTELLDELRDLLKRFSQDSPQPSHHNENPIPAQMFARSPIVRQAVARTHALGGGDYDREMMGGQGLTGGYYQQQHHQQQQQQPVYPNQQYGQPPCQQETSVSSVWHKYHRSSTASHHQVVAGKTSVTRCDPSYNQQQGYSSTPASPTVANVMAGLLDGSRTDRQGYNSTCAPSPQTSSTWFQPTVTSPAQRDQSRATTAVPTNMSGIIPARTSKQDKRSLGDGDGSDRSALSRCPSDLKRTISKLIHSFKKNLQEIVEAKEAAAKAGQKMEMSRDELADFVRREIKKALTTPEKTVPAENKRSSHLQRKSVRSTPSMSTADTTERSEKTSSIRYREAKSLSRKTSTTNKTRRPMSPASSTRSTVGKDVRHPFAYEHTPERMASPCSWYEQRSGLVVPSRVPGKDSFTQQTSYANLPFPPGMRPPDRTSCYFYTQSHDAIPVGALYASGLAKERARLPSKPRTIVQTIPGPEERARRKPVEEIPPPSPPEPHATRSTSVASSITVESRTWTRELTKILDESLFLNVRTVAEKAVESDPIKTSDAEVQIEIEPVQPPPPPPPEVPPVEHKDQMVMTDEEVPIAPPIPPKQAVSDIAVQTDVEDPPKKTPSLPKMESVGLQVAESGDHDPAPSSSSAAMEEKVVDVFKAWLQSADFKDILSDSITNKIKSEVAELIPPPPPPPPVVKIADSCVMTDFFDSQETQLSKTAVSSEIPTESSNSTSKDNTVNDSAAWEEILGSTRDRLAAAMRNRLSPPPAMSVESSSATIPSAPVLPNFDRLSSARRSLLMAGQSALARAENVMRPPGAPMPFTAAEAIEKGPPTPYETLSLNKHMELRKRLDAVSKNFKKPSDLILEEAKKALDNVSIQELPPAGNQLPALTAPPVRLEEVVLEPKASALPQMTQGGNWTKIPTIDNNSLVPQSEVVVDTNTAKYQPSFPDQTQQQMSPPKPAPAARVTSAGTNAQGLLRTRPFQPESYPQYRTPDQVKKDAENTYGHQVLNRLMKALNVEDISKQSTDNKEESEPIVKSMSSTSELGGQSLPSSREFAVHQTKQFAGKSRMPSALQSPSPSPRQSATQMLASVGPSITSMSANLPNKTQPGPTWGIRPAGAPVGPMGRSLESESSELSSIPSWLDRPKTRGVILDGRNRVILEAADHDNIQRQYVVTTADDSVLSQSVNSPEPAAVMIRTLSAEDESAGNDYLGEDEEATHNDVPVMLTTTVTGSSNMTVQNNSNNDWTTASVNQLATSAQEELSDDPTLQHSRQEQHLVPDHKNEAQEEVADLSYQRRIHPGARSYASDDDDTIAESIEVPDDTLPLSSSIQQIVKKPEPMLRKEIAEWVLEDNTDDFEEQTVSQAPEMPVYEEDSDDDYQAPHPVRSSQSSRTYPGTEDWVTNTTSRVELNREWAEEWGVHLSDSEDEDYFPPSPDTFQLLGGKPAPQESDEDDEPPVMPRNKAALQRALQSERSGSSGAESRTRLSRCSSNFSSTTVSEQYDRLMSLRRNREASNLSSMHAIGRDLPTEDEMGNEADDDETYSRMYYGGTPPQNWREALQREQKPHRTQLHQARSNSNDIYQSTQLPTRESNTSLLGQQLDLRMSQSSSRFHPYRSSGTTSFETSTRMLPKPFSSDSPPQLSNRPSTVLRVPANASSAGQSKKQVSSQSKGIQVRQQSLMIKPTRHASLDQAAPSLDDEWNNVLIGDSSVSETFARRYRIPQLKPFPS